MLVTVFGIVTEARPLQSMKASPSILVTPFGMMMVVRLRQPLKVTKPMRVMPSGIVMDFKLRHRWYLQVTLYQHFIILTIEK